MEEKQQQREHNKRIAELRDRDLLGNPMEEPSGFSAEFLTKDYSQNSCTFREGVESTQKKEPCNPLADVTADTTGRQTDRIRNFTSYRSKYQNTLM